MDHLKKANGNYFGPFGKEGDIEVEWMLCS
jgi:hypothetical protein